MLITHCYIVIHVKQPYNNKLQFVCRGELSHKNVGIDLILYKNADVSTKWNTILATHSYVTIFMRGHQKQLCIASPVLHFVDTSEFYYWNY